MNTASQVAKRLVRQPSFLIAFVVLLVAAVSLNAATQFLKLHFKKLPVPLARSLEMVPMKLGGVAPRVQPWVCVSKDELTDDLEQELGTKTYIFRHYLDSAIIHPADITRFDGLSAKDRMRTLGELRNSKDYPPGVVDRAIMHVSVTYYTGKADTVAHIPDRCFVADGYEPTAYETESWDVGSPLAPRGQVPVRYITFEDQNRQGTRTKDVAYFFHTNGHYTSDPTQVRIALQNLLEKYGYYAKVELMVEGGDHVAARAAMTDFLRQGLAEIEKSMPNWNTLPR